MTQNRFDQTLADSQATAVQPVAARDFDVEAYAEYVRSLQSRCSQFWTGASGVLVYRRVRVAEVFSFGCRDMKASLEWQLGALKTSMAYRADIPNFLEPWYGIGTIAGAYGIDYTWKPGQAPAVVAGFKSVVDAMSAVSPCVEATPIAAGTLAMIRYFVDQTRGRIPLCLTDTQSPLNVACNVVDMSSLFLEMYDRPDQVRAFMKQIAGLIDRFTRVQQEAIGDMLVWPGHGYASAGCFVGLGISDDNALMVSRRQYRDMVAPAVESLGAAFDGWAFHSCGDWSGKIDAVKEIPGLRMVDAAFSEATDPSPNDPSRFAQAFAGTGVVVNARIVGDAEVVVETVRKLWAPGMKLVVVTYCRDPREQTRVYDRVHEICV